VREEGLAALLCCCHLSRVQGSLQALLLSQQGPLRCIPGWRSFLVLLAALSAWCWHRLVAFPVLLNAAAGAAGWPVLAARQRAVAGPGRGLRGVVNTKTPAPGPAGGHRAGAMVEKIVAVVIKQKPAGAGRLIR
jgi:hypothetical protein